VDEVVLALDKRADTAAVIGACADLADRISVVPAVTHMERYLGWMHSECTGDWILRADDDELPSSDLLASLPALVAERELTHYWLPRRWVHPNPAEFIAEGAWLTDIQVRLVRNVPGLWRFQGRLHSNIEVLGTSRVLDMPLLHLVLLLSDVEARREKVAAYGRLVPGLKHESGRPLVEVFVPEDVPPMRHERLVDEDHRRIVEFLNEARGSEPPIAVGEPRIARPPVTDLDRWLGDRPVSAGAYRARVRLVNVVAPMAAEALRHVQIEVTNLGDDWWAPGPQPEPEIVVGHRWRRPDGTDIETPTPRTAFTERVGPGATTRLTVALLAPRETGELELRVDVVHEWVRWFDCPATQVVTATNPYESKFFEQVEAGSRQSAEAVLPRILELIPAQSLLDVGCGTGAWVRAAIDLGVHDVQGVDGPWIDPAALEFPAEHFSGVDLTASVDLGRRFDLALSLEVAEHLPEAAAGAFVRTLVGSAPVVAFSAAVPGQGGVRHLNEQWPAYWAARFAEQGYEPIDCLRPALWDDERIEWWYAQNLLLFAEPTAVEANPALRDHPQRGKTPLALVHPRARLNPT
jgi:SAM-dependent methyltransferase